VAINGKGWQAKVYRNHRLKCDFFVNQGLDLPAQRIENPLSKDILAGRFGPKDTIRVGVRGGPLVFGEEPAVELAK
jgi:hypothetical protein